MTFKDFNFDQGLQEGLDAMGFENPTPVQEKAIPVILEGKDVIACAQTGTGKTAAFILPVLHKIASTGKSGLNTLVLAPTRELAIQIDQQIQGLAYFAGISSIPVYGGGDGLAWEQQRVALESGAEIIVATPGRLIALLAGGKINLDSLEHLILDEADRMLDMGFMDDILKIVNYLPKERQTVLFSATMPPKIRQFAKKLLQEPEEITLSVGKTAEGVTQVAYLAYDHQKEALVRNILSQKNYEAVIIFASTKEKVKSLFKLLKKDFDVEAFHSDLEQLEREKIMSRFKNRALKILVGTDIISRGIDVVGIELVINYDVPGDPEDYVHRVGRTARADSKGEAITFISNLDQQKFARIENLIGMDVEKLPLPEGLGEGPSYEPKSKGNSGNKSSGGRNPKQKSGVKPSRKAPQQKQQSKKDLGNSKQSKSRAEQRPKPENTLQTADSKGEKPKHSGSKFGQRRNVIDEK